MVQKVAMDFDTAVFINLGSVFGTHVHMLRDYSAVKAENVFIHGRACMMVIGASLRWVHQEVLGHRA